MKDRCLKLNNSGRRCEFALCVLFLRIAFAFACWQTEAIAQTDPQSNNTNAATPSSSELLQKLDQLAEQNAKLEKQNHELMDQMATVRRELASQTNPPDRTTPGEPFSGTVSTGNSGSQDEPQAAADISALQEPQKRWGTYTPNLGFKVADTEYGDLNVSIYTYIRYLNQLGLNSSYTNYFGVTSSVQQRQDIQIQKVQIKFLGWLLNPKFRYFLYAWTSNASQGLPAQVVLAGNLSYAFDKHFTFAGGITSLPGTRSTEGNFPFWLAVDSRLIADEFFRPSYTSGLWARGEIINHLSYMIMDGNNLSTLGVSAAQLDNKFNTVSTALIWTPKTEDFGKGFGDFEHHDKLATRLAGHFTSSTETAQEQPNSDQFENTQIRLEDGSVVFTPNLFGQGITVEKLAYKMTAFDGGLKYRGFSLDGEYFMRWLNHFSGPGTSDLSPIFSHGFQMQASAMAIPKTFQVYLGGSTIYGKYGNPWDFRAGMNWFPWHNRVVRWNNEFLYLNRSPVGYTSVPFALGATGPVFHSNVEMAF
ncbi:MAG TPA: hypothetical protein VF753_10255 [Terriglobales bacterium]